MGIGTATGTGALSGAGSGALAGSAFGPVGTGVGAVGGALIGGIGGYIAGSEDKDELRRQEAIAQYQKQQDALNRAEKDRQYLRLLREQGLFGTDRSSMDYYAKNYKPTF